MNLSAFALAASSLMLATAGCDEAASLLGVGGCSKDRALVSGSPIDAADEAVSRGDTRLLAVRGFTTYAPGVPREAWPRYGYVVLPNTSDSVKDASCGRYNDEAEQYAERYNERVIERTQTGTGQHQ